MLLLMKWNSPIDFTSFCMMVYGLICFQKFTWKFLCLILKLKIWIFYPIDTFNWTNVLCFTKMLTWIGTAIATVVTIAEILKNNGLATELSKGFLLVCNYSHLHDPCSNTNQFILVGTEVLTSTVGMKDENKGRLVQKAKVSSQRISVRVI